MNLEDQICLHKSLSQKIETLEEQQKQLSLSHYAGHAGKSLQLGAYQVKCYSRLSVKLTLDQTRTLNAIKLEETVDKDKIKTLYKNGHPIECVSEIEYIQITALNDPQG